MLDLPQKFGKYDLTERIAIGGMAEIFKATAQGLGDFNKLLAIKRLHPRYSEDQDFIHMLVDEAKIASQLSHSNIGQIFDLGREGELIYIAMEFIDGRDLYRVLQRLNKLGQPMPIAVAVYIIMEIAAGLDYAHRKTAPDGTPLRIIHRDISPQNIIVSWEGEVKLIDFGIAKAAMRAFETESGVIKGKFYYMSPEQARGDTLDHRSDIFSLGLCLYELLTGATVYREDDDVTLLSRVRRADISPPTSMRPEIPHDLERIVMKTLARNPKRRYQSANQLQAALSSFLYSGGQPFSKIQLGGYVRDLFEREQVFEDLPMSYHDRFLSRVDYTDQATGLVSSLMLEDEVTAVVSERDTIRPGDVPIDAVIVNHDPYAEASFDGDFDEFEGAPTRANAGGGPLAWNDEEENTWVYAGAEPEAADRSAAARKLPPSSPAMPPMPPPMPGRGPMPPASPDPPPNLKPPAPALVKKYPELDFEPAVHTGIVTGVYTEPTRITDLDSVDIEAPEDEVKSLAPAPRARPRTVEEPFAELSLSFRLLFAAGLTVLLLVGGTISALASVFIDSRSDEPNPTLAIGQTNPDDEDPNAAGDKEPGDKEPGAVAAATDPAEEGLDTRGLVVTVTGPLDATVKLGELPEQDAPATFDKLVLGQSYDLKITADNHETHTKKLIVTEEMPSGYKVVLKPRLGSLKIVTDPPGAAIMLNGKATSKSTPGNLTDLDRSKKHEVSLVLEGHKPFAAQIAWTNDDEDVKTIDTLLEPTSAEEPEDPPAEDPPVVAVSKRDTPKANTQRPGRRESRAERRARERRERRDRQRREREARANRTNNGGGGGNQGSAGFGTLSVNSRPWGQVYVDGRRVANETPVRGLRVKAGFRKVKVVFPTAGGAAVSRTVPIKEGQNATIFVKP